MKKLLLIVAIAASLFSGCQKKYQYVEEVIEHSILGGIKESTKEPENIKAANDTIAYINAYRKYCISQSVYQRMANEGYGEYLDIPIGFKLYNSDGEDITNIYFTTRTKQEEKIASLLTNIDTSTHSTEMNTMATKIDSVKIKELLPYFRVKKDEFDPNGGTWYEPKSAPKYTNQNGIYLYFKVDNTGIKNLRFRVQYYADDWLFFQKVRFSLDSAAYEYIPVRTETDNGDGYIWEWFDESLNFSDKNLIYALANAKSAKMKFIGRQYYGIRTISKQQIIDIKRTLELYNAMGGVY